jgi:acetyl-CoA synthetase
VTVKTIPRFIRKGSAMNKSAANFLNARNFLLEHRKDYDTAYRDYRQPELDQFNWALDYFDAMALGNEAPALLILDEDGKQTRRSFAQLSLRSGQVANHLRSLGVKRGDRVLLMMGNELALWELMLACIKLGAVMVPATALLTAEDLQDRLDRGEVRHVVAASEQTPKFVNLTGAYGRISVGASKTRVKPPKPSILRATRGPPTLCCSTSPRAPRPSPSWCCTPTRAIRPGI